MSENNEFINNGTDYTSSNTINSDILTEIIENNEITEDFYNETILSNSLEIISDINLNSTINIL